MTDGLVTQYAKKFKSYLSNRNLKGAGVEIKFTVEQVDEYIKCKEDPCHFIRNYMYIINLDKGKQLFGLYDYQEDLIETLLNNRFVIAKMPRQVGKTATIVGFFLWNILFHADQRIAILSNKASNAKDALNKVKLAYEMLPMWLQQGVVEWNKTSIKLENGSEIIASATTGSAGRSGSFNLLFLDEFAFVAPNIAQEFYTSVFPTLSSSTQGTTKIFIASTPKGMNHFWKMWTDATEGRSDYIPKSVNWWQVPGRDDAWKESQIRQLGSNEAFEQEHGGHFLGSSAALIDGKALQDMSKAYTPPLRKQGEINIYEEPICDIMGLDGKITPGHQYAIVVDTSRGQDMDHSAFSVLDVTSTPYMQVATYRSNTISPMLYPHIVYNAAKMYNEAMILVEINETGGQVVDILHTDLEYENLLTTTNSKFGGPQRLTMGFGKSSKLGIKTSKATKSVGCAALKTLVEDHKMVVRDFETISELTTFVSNGKSYAAEKGNHDDLAMGLVLFSWLTTQQAFKDLTNIDIRAQLLEQRRHAIEQSVLPFGFIDNGLDDERERETFIANGCLWEEVD